MSEWQPIETAPKDGSHFLAYDPVAKEYDVCRMEWWLGKWVCESLQSDLEFGPHPDQFNADRATHWQPLPEPPDAA